jgi:hypothetical protein
VSGTRGDVDRSTVELVLVQTRLFLLTSNVMPAHVCLNCLYERENRDSVNHSSVPSPDQCDPIDRRTQVNQLSSPRSGEFGFTAIVQGADGFLWPSVDLLQKDIFF